ncbi:hypothetical protein SAMN05421821_1083 [Mucilaginibacter lappiensis]|uniref:Uncharacterized protein n=1 Tax=Mucilaginibacter lappiensis TaxID=354630 RepID=A0ABR6PPH9_9SPHI|nr:hypothetical protein [Mucilaginibacter lappiensis]MBB6110191.1 hypothetical protein [Mucilaginibacter lappiensis]SIR50405.1 hypothetical protein SAMN05421821_1083 [Mucilaginibacter lappiensis]
MKSLLKKAAICIVAALFTLGVKAQGQDYVITTQGDSIPCTIKIPLITCGDGNYKTTENSPLVKIKHETIKEYYISKKNTLYRSVIKEGKSKPEFLLVLETGKINLYEEVTEIYVNNTVTQITKWYVSKGSDIARPLKTDDVFMSKSRKQREGEFTTLISDNNAVYAQYTSENKFSFKRIRNLVQQYNNTTSI